MITTKLLPSDRRHRQRRLVAAAIVACIVILSGAGAVTNWRDYRAPSAPTPAMIIVIQTTTAQPQPTWTPAPTAEPVIVTVLVERTVFVEVEAASQGTQPEAAFPTAAQEGVPVMLENESLADYAARVSSQQHQFGRP